MKAFQVTTLSHYSNIPLTLDASTPTLGPSQVLIDVYSAGLNFFDVCP
jgi:NADPH:quinone reductase